MRIYQVFLEENALLRTKKLIMDINSRFQAIIDTLFDGKQNAFAKAIGVAPSVIANVVGSRKGKPSFDVLSKICANADISEEWLLSGKGNMKKNTQNSSKIQKESEDIPTAERVAGDIKPIPLVTEQAAAGFGNDCFSIQESDVKDYYVIPKFRFNHVDFMIEVSGISMYPHFKSGDVIACTILHEAKYIQWNRCHVIATRDQGILVKRIMPSEKEGCFKMVSDNKNFPPFDLPKEDITGLALVVGCVSLE